MFSLFYRTLYNQQSQTRSRVFIFEQFSMCLLLKLIIIVIIYPVLVISNDINKLEHI